MNPKKWSILIFVYAAVLCLHSGLVHADEEKLGVRDIIKKVVETYKDMDGYQAKGEVNTEMDMSGVDLSSMPGMPAGADTDSPLLKSAMQKQTSKHTFEIKLSRIGDFLIQWDQDMNLFKMQGAVWSVDGNHKFKMQNPMMNQPVIEPETMALALASATGVSGGAANTIPSIFYDLDHNALSVLQNAKRLEDEKLDEEDCYVISGDTAGQALQFWISKETNHVLQRKHILGAMPNMEKQLTDENIKAALKSMNQEATPEAIEKMRATMKQSMSMSAKVKGFSIERHTNIKINPELKEEDFTPVGIDEK